MAVQNRIVKVQKRNRALVKFDAARIRKAILGAAEAPVSGGGVSSLNLSGLNLNPAGLSLP